MICSDTEQQIGIKQTLNTQAYLDSLFFVSLSFSTLLIAHHLTGIGRKEKELATVRFKVSVGSQLYNFTASAKLKSSSCAASQRRLP